VVQDFILELGKEHSTWSLPADRADLYAWMQFHIQRLEAHLRSRKGKIRGLGAINPNQPFHVRALIPRLHAALKGVLRSDWVIQIVQDYTTPTKTKRYQAGTTLLVDSETGLVRYAIYKANPAAASRLQAAQEEFTAVSFLPPPQERRLRLFAFDPSAAIRLDTARINQVTLPVAWEALAPGPQANTWRWWTTTRLRSAFTPRLTWQTLTFLLWMVFRPRRPIHSSTNRWSMRCPSAPSVISSARWVAWLCGRHAR